MLMLGICPDLVKGRLVCKDVVALRFKGHAPRILGSLLPATAEEERAESVRDLVPRAASRIALKAYFPYLDPLDDYNPLHRDLPFYQKTSHLKAVPYMVATPPPSHLDL